MNQEPQNKVSSVQPDKVTVQQTVQNRKAAKKTAIILGVVALGFFIWSIYKVMNHATG